MPIPIFSAIKPLFSSWKVITFIGVLFFLLILKILYTQNQALTLKLEQSQNALAVEKNTIIRMQQQMVKINTLDAQLTKELNDANQQIDRLNDELRIGSKRLQLNHPNRQPIKPRPSAVANGASSRSRDEFGTSDLRENYIQLRRDIKHAQLQIVGLQEYIKALPKQCVSPNIKIMHNQKIND